MKKKEKRLMVECYPTKKGLRTDVTINGLNDVEILGIIEYLKIMTKRRVLNLINEQENEKNKT